VGRYGDTGSIFRFRQWGGNTRNSGIKLTDPIKAAIIKQAKERLDE